MFAVQSADNQVMPSAGAEADPTDVAALEGCTQVVVRLEAC